LTDEAKVTNSLDSQQASSIPNDNFVIIKPTTEGADKSLARLGRKQTTATEEFGVHISYL